MAKFFRDCWEGENLNTALLYKISIIPVTNFINILQYRSYQNSNFNITNNNSLIILQL